MKSFFRLLIISLKSSVNLSKHVWCAALRLIPLKHKFVNIYTPKEMEYKPEKAPPYADDTDLPVVSVTLDVFSRILYEIFAQISIWRRLTFRSKGLSCESS